VVIGSAHYASYGAAQVFVRSGGVWSHEATLTEYASPFGGSSAAQFGSSVALDGDTALVGAPGVNAAYLFTRSGGTWTQQQKWTASGGANFGFSLAVSGDTALVGGGDGASMYGRSGSTWTQRQRLLGIGGRIALAGDHALAGMYSFVLSDGSWTARHRLPASAGSAVALSADSVLSGNILAGGIDAADAGAVYEYPFGE
jgi:hypothetical protein